MMKRIKKAFHPHAPSIENKLNEHERRTQAARELIAMYSKELAIITRGESEKREGVRI